MTEFHQREAYFKKFNNIDTYKTEVPVYSRSVDAVILDKKCSNLSAIEFKLTNWKKVIEQAQNIKTAFDYISICLMEPKRNNTKLLIIEECKKYGIGLIFSNYINDSYLFEEILNPIKQEKI
ncbi:hypothetical protein [Spiroplasma endosymbiont of Nebria brevicollis]|uniref:hypothetical protein n=1 Tax=Spiroplasma endosymbiont of Nebria brevicollis TaxID=3066284 RepID=UPI00313C5873